MEVCLGRTLPGLEKRALRNVCITLAEVLKVCACALQDAEGDWMLLHDEEDWSEVVEATRSILVVPA